METKGKRTENEACPELIRITSRADPVEQISRSARKIMFRGEKMVGEA